MRSVELFAGAGGLAMGMSNAAISSWMAWQSALFCPSRTHEYPNMPGLSGSRPRNPLASSEAGVSLKM